MFIKFANTQGNVFGGNIDVDDNEPDSANVYDLSGEELRLGSVFTYPRGIIIVDRDAKHSTSQLNCDDVIELLQQLIVQLYITQIDDHLKIYLPRMYSSMMKEAECQTSFQNISKFNSSNRSLVCSMTMAKTSRQASSTVQTTLIHV